MAEKSASLTKTHQGDAGAMRLHAPAPASAAGLAASLLGLQQGLGNAAVGRLLVARRPGLQAKLRIGRPGDAYEQEADRVADAVVGAAGPDGGPPPISRLAGEDGDGAVRRCADCGGTCGGTCGGGGGDEEEHAPEGAGGTLQRQCQCGGQPEDEQLVQGRAAPGETPHVPAGFAAQLSSLRGGAPLPPGLRAFFEPRFGHDFGAVRLHTGAAAERSAAAVGARAFTLGNDVVFGRGELAPDTPAGRHLLAHELTHVVQQTPLVARRQPLVQRAPAPGAGGNGSPLGAGAAALSSAAGSAAEPSAAGPAGDSAATEPAAAAASDSAAASAAAASDSAAAVASDSAAASDAAASESAAAASDAAASNSATAAASESAAASDSAAAASGSAADAGSDSAAAAAPDSAANPISDSGARPEPVAPGDSSPGAPPAGAATSGPPAPSAGAAREAGPAAHGPHPPAPDAVAPQAPGAASPEAVPALVVEDDAVPVGEGQMAKSEFLARLRSEVSAAADAGLAGTEHSSRGCPLIAFWIGTYEGRSAERINRDLPRFTSGSPRPVTAAQYIPLIAARVRAGVDVWARSGEITGVPPGIPLPGMALVDSLLGSAVGSAGGPAGGAARLLFKSHSGGARGAPHPLAVRARLGPGRPLEGTLRARMEGAFGQSFSHVRVHHDSAAGSLADRLNARAFTVGPHVAFGPQEYRPGTLYGDALIAHELAHVVQQGGASETFAPLDPGGDYGALERDADAAAIGAVTSLWGKAGGALRAAARQAVPTLRSGLRLQRCGGSPAPAKPSAAPAGANPPAAPAPAAPAGACPPGPAWTAGKHVAPNFVLTKPAAKRSNSDPSVTSTSDPTFAGQAVVDCKANVWRYQADSIESKGNIQIVYFTENRYPAPTPTDDSGALTNVTKANWQAIVKDLDDHRAGIPVFWSAYRAEDLHENYHWATEWQGEVNKEVPKAEGEIEKLQLPFASAPTAAAAATTLQPQAKTAFDAAMHRARAAYDKLGDDPGDPPYQAQAPAIDALSKRVKDHAATNKW
jgi:hypothetical protein